MFYYKRLATYSTVMLWRKRIRSVRILTASRHIAVLPCELFSFQYVAPGLAVIVRIPAVQEGEEKLVSPDLQSLGRRRHLRTADGVLSVFFLIFLKTRGTRPC